MAIIVKTRRDGLIPISFQSWTLPASVQCGVIIVWCRHQTIITPHCTLAGRVQDWKDMGMSPSRLVFTMMAIGCLPIPTTLRAQDTPPPFQMATQYSSDL